MANEKADEMIEWFRQNFDAPADHLFYGSGGEDGYEWGHYTPHYAPDVLKRQFPDADERERKKAERELTETDVHYIKKSEL
jgi:hypothetical protein